MTLLYPSFLWFFIPLLLAFYFLTKRVSSSKTNTFIVKVHLIVMILIIVSLSRPVVKGEIEESNIVAKDLIIALDLSYSMRATDINPSRYAYATELIDDFLKINSKDNIMLMGFTSNPLLLSPPTTDHTLISASIKSINLEYILTKGTSISALFNKIDKMKQKDKSIILLSDGGEEELSPKSVEIIKKNNLKLIIIPLGTKSGTTIARDDGTLVKDKEGELVVSRINPMLKELSNSVNGEYLSAKDSAKRNAKKIQSIINSSDNSSNILSKKQLNVTELYQIPLLLALILFLMLHTRASKYLLTLFLLFSANAQASFFDAYYLNKAYENYHNKDFNQTKVYLSKIEEVSLQSRLAQANNAYKMANYNSAIAYYASIRSTNPKIKQMIFYNIANAYVQVKNYEKAKEYYSKSLQLGEDSDAKYNLGLIAIIENKNNGLGISHPKSQNSSKSNSKKENDNKANEKKSEEQSSSGSGTGGEENNSKKKKEKTGKLLLDKNAKEQPISSKVYELINKGYIRETKPW